jgi:hypothetical protein
MDVTTFKKKKPRLFQSLKNKDHTLRMVVFIAIVISKSNKWGYIDKKGNSTLK